MHLNKAWEIGRAYVGCTCPACEYYRKYSVGGYEVPVQFDWTELWKKYSYPYSPSLANEESVPTEKAMSKDTPKIFQFNYSTVDTFGFGYTHNIVLECYQDPLVEFSIFMQQLENNVRCHLIEHFLVRWENGEYVRV